MPQCCCAAMPSKELTEHHHCGNMYQRQQHPYEIQVLRVSKPGYLSTRQGKSILDSKRLVCQSNIASVCVTKLQQHLDTAPKEQQPQCRSSIALNTEYSSSISSTALGVCESQPGILQSATRSAHK